MKSDEIKKTLPSTTQKYINAISQNKAGIITGISFSIIFGFILFVSTPLTFRYIKYSKNFLSSIAAQGFTFFIFILFLWSLFIFKNSLKKYKEDKEKELKRKKQKNETAYLQSKVEKQEGKSH
ncbi:MAG: hypothetical protein H7A23_24385 [Leptospiraceae bacterium]|nr:hypothetical protein [Leptospiraceae bacterium]MCP5497704.1 hypothetical protein [Leptospiraceae bacterium]